jgi:hypothetical protein
MADEKKQESSSLTTALPVTVLLAMLAGLFFTNSLPYQEERPSSRPVPSSHAAAQDVDARLWQDPFSAIKDANKEAQKVFIEANNDGKTKRLAVAVITEESSPHKPGQIYNNYTPTAEDKITVLAVTLPGGPYQEDEEQRMRRRYAVLSALANQGATPEDEQHIGYFQPTKPAKDFDLQKKVAFEWWSLPDDKNKVLLLWVDESSLFGKPVAKLKELLGQVRQAKPENVSLQFNNKVIGPNTSTLLWELLKEVKGDSVTQCADKSTPEKINNDNIVYYSAGATASDERFEQIKKGETVSGYLCNRGITLYRTTATDDALMCALAKELAVRQVKAPYIDVNCNKPLPINQDGKHDHVVILSEWDTFYGQSMPVAFKKAWDTDPEGKDIHKHKVVHVFGYMRGLDGKLPDKDDKSGSGAEKKSDSKDKSGVNAQIEPPEGQYQKDYLRRLADKIFVLNQRLKDEGNRNGVAAIGVLGSDVHDKLMILEALRQNFPHKLFFTTNLDAAYSRSDKWHQTHNLLVASAFDLELRPELQDRIPPFRDSGQTAFFLAAQLALKKEVKIADLIMPPRLFEIGRSRPMPVPTCEQSNDNELPCEDKSLPTSPNSYDESKCTWTNWSACNNTVQPPIFATSQLHWTPVGIMVIVSVASLFPLFSWRIRKWIMEFYQDPKSHPYFASCVAIALLLLVCLLMRVWNSYIIKIYAEPFYWREGLSAWPSQLMRLLVILVAVGFYFWGRKRIQDMQEDLQLQSSDKHKPVFALPSSPAKERTRFNLSKFTFEKLGTKEASVLSCSTYFVHVPNDCNVLCIRRWEQKDEIVDPNVLWTNYLVYCHQKKWGVPGWFLRVMFYCLLFLVLGCSLMLISGFPNVPVRGMTALYWHYGILFTAVIVTIMLTMWVVDNARLCYQLILLLSARSSKWNNIATDWAINKNKIAPECVDDWLDIQLVARLTATMQHLIWGPMACIALMVLARSSFIDDWDIPWGLMIMVIVMLVYAFSTEIFLQRGAKKARTKAVEELTRKIREQLNLEHPNEAVIKRIETEIERIQSLREGAFRPWYELPLLQSFGGVGTLVYVQQYLAGLLGGGAM